MVDKFQETVVDNSVDQSTLNVLAADQSVRLDVTNIDLSRLPENISATLIFKRKGPMFLPQVKTARDISTDTEMVDMPQLERAKHVTARSATTINFLNLRELGSLDAGEVMDLDLSNLRHLGALDQAPLLDLVDRIQLGRLSVFSVRNMDLSQLESFKQIDAFSAVNIILPAQHHLSRNVRADGAAFYERRPSGYKADSSTILTVHLVTQDGGHFTPIDDFIWVAPYPNSEEYARSRLGFFPQTQVMAKGPYSGGACQAGFQELIDRTGLIKLPGDDLAINPNVPFTLDVFDPEKDPSYERSRYSAYLVFTNHKGRTIRLGINTSPQEVLDLLPNVSASDRIVLGGPRRENSINAASSGGPRNPGGGPS